MDDSSFDNSTEIPGSLASHLTAMTLSVFGLLENGMVVGLLFTRSRLRKRPHVFFILSLSCLDLMIALNVLLLTIAGLVSQMRSRIFCGTMFTCAVIFFGMSLIQALIIAIERYFAVTATSLYVSYFSGWKKYICVSISFVILSVYVVILVVNFPPILAPLDCNEDRLFDYWNRYIVTICTQVIFIPVIIVTIIIYTVSLLKLRQRMHQIDSMSTFAENTMVETDLSNTATTMGQNTLPTVTPTSTSRRVTVLHGEPSHSSTHTRETEASQIAKKKASISKLSKALKTVAIIDALLFLCFVPNFVVKLMIMFDKQVYTVSLITKLLPVLHPVLNPILYVFCLPEVRKELKCSH